MHVWTQFCERSTNTVRQQAVTLEPSLTDP